MSNFIQRRLEPGTHPEAARGVLRVRRACLDKSTGECGHVLFITRWIFPLAPMLRYFARLPWVDKSMGRDTEE